MRKVQHKKRNHKAKRASKHGARVPALKMKLKKGDHVMMVSGKDKGKTGAILKVFPKANKVVVEGLGIAKRHRRPLAAGQSGRIVEMELPVHASNVMLMDPKEKKPTRVKRVLKDGKIVRTAHKSGTALA
jgi:large subunit ribosomal protein L24